MKNPAKSPIKTPIKTPLKPPSKSPKISENGGGDNARVVSQLRLDKIRGVLKKALKSRGLTYEDLGESMGLSLPTVKRMLTQDDLSLMRLFTICEITGLTFGDLSLLVDKEIEREKSYFSIEQEEFFAKNPHYLNYLFAMFEKKDPIEIQKQSGLTQRSQQMYLTKLEVLGLIKKKGERWQTVHQEAPNWLRRGPLAKAQIQNTLRNTNEFFARRLALALSQADGSHPVKFSLGIYTCSEELEKEYNESLSKLRVEFEQKAKVAELSSAKPIRSKLIIESKSVFLKENDPDISTNNFFLDPIKNL